MADLFWPGDERAGALLSQQRFLAAMLEVEQQWLSALSACGLAPAGAARSLDDVVGAEDVAELATAAEASGNPVVPLVRLVRQRLGDGPAATWLHRGLTSQDVVDTALVLCLREALVAVLADLRAQSMTLAALAERHRATPMAARTLTQPAVPLTFGLKAATWLDSVIEAAWAVRSAKKRLAVQVGGAAGTLAASTELFRRVGSSDPAAASLALVADLADRLGLPPAAPWHTVRGRLTGAADALVAAGDAWGRIASDVALLGRPEVGELAEPTVPGRGGSSTMPHKANPILSVLLRRHALAAPMLASTMHVAAATYVDERPDGAWHVEWDTLRVLGRRSVVAASQATELLAGLTVHSDRMAEAARRGELLAERRSLDAVVEDQPGGPPYLGATDRIIAQSLARCAQTWKDDG
ncbi:lyase family protein [Micromonospora sp. NPDC005173]|uniref:lyase family protein n=1 Tax=Micromonospora sp. NPDC005173 TaxID=3157165 RepID=UPI0033B3282C